MILYIFLVFLIFLILYSIFNLINFQKTPSIVNANMNILETLPTLTCAVINTPVNTPINPINLSGSGGSGSPYSFSCKNLPSGLSLSEKGVIQGTPLQTGLFAYNIEITDKSGNKNAIQCKGNIISASVSTGPATDCVMSNWSNWSPCVDRKQTRTRTITIPAQNGGANCPSSTDSQSCDSSIQIVGTLPAISPDENSFIELDISKYLTVSGSDGPYICSSIDLYNLTGLSISSNGIISGITNVCHNEVCNYTFTLLLSDVITGSTNTFSIPIRIIKSILPSTSCPIFSVTNGQDITTPILVGTGGSPPYTFSADGLPNGLSMSSTGTITGTVNEPSITNGTISNSITIHDNNGVINTISCRGITITSSSSSSMVTFNPPNPSINNIDESHNIITHYSTVALNTLQPNLPASIYARLNALTNLIIYDALYTYPGIPTKLEDDTPILSNTKYSIPGIPQGNYLLYNNTTNSPVYTEIMQGGLGDCAIDSTMACIAYKNSSFTKNNIFADTQQPNIYYVMLYNPNNLHPVLIKISSELPVDNTPPFANNGIFDTYYPNSSQPIIWSHLYLKALALLINIADFTYLIPLSTPLLYGYNALVGGSILDRIISIFTGTNVNSILSSDYPILKTLDFNYNIAIGASYSDSNIPLNIINNLIQLVRATFYELTVRMQIPNAVNENINLNEFNTILNQLFASAFNITNPIPYIQNSTIPVMFSSAKYINSNTIELVANVLLSSPLNTIDENTLSNNLNRISVIQPMFNIQIQSIRIGSCYLIYNNNKLTNALINSHAYSILEYNNYRDEFTVRNPWGSFCVLPGKRYKNGIFKMKSIELYAFNYICHCQVPQ